jgi:phosphoribosylanthranilate isomerase
MTVRVKICGITRAEDAALAVELGASALGFVFWPSSPRAVSAAQARSIAAAIPPFVARVGVFVNVAPAEVAAVVRDVGLDAIQLHGDEAVADYGAVGARVIKAVSAETDDDVARAIALPIEATPLVDAADPIKRGGTGQLADWDRAAQIAHRRPILLAGGLHPGNVTTAITRVRPWAVDVSSGVETAPGIKSADRLAAFFAAAQLGGHS